MFDGNWMDFTDLVGKTIETTQQMRRKLFDDVGFLRLEFTDGTHCVIEGGYGGVTGDSEGEFPTQITILDPEEESDLEPYDEEEAF